MVVWSMLVLEQGDMELSALAGLACRITPDYKTKERPALIANPERDQRGRSPRQGFASPVISTGCGRGLYVALPWIGGGAIMDGEHFESSIKLQRVGRRWRHHIRIMSQGCWTFPGDFGTRR